MLQWSSSPVLGIGKFVVPVLNVLIATYTFVTGLHVDQVSFYSASINFKIIESLAPGPNSKQKSKSHLSL